MPQPKDKDWLNGYKNKTPIYAVYKRPTSKQGTHRLKVKGWKKIFYTSGDQKKAEVAILISDKIDCEKIYRGPLHNNQRINPRGRYNNYKYICTQDKSTAYERQM